MTNTTWPQRLGPELDRASSRIQRCLQMRIGREELAGAHFRPHRPVALEEKGHWRISVELSWSGSDSERWDFVVDDAGQILHQGNESFMAIAEVSAANLEEFEAIRGKSVRAIGSYRRVPQRWVSKRREFLEDPDGPIDLAEECYVLMGLRTLDVHELHNTRDMNKPGAKIRVHSLYHHGYRSRHNVDGFLKYSLANDKGIESFLQIFRDGRVESAATRELLLHDHHRGELLRAFLRAGLLLIGEYRSFMEAKQIAIRTAFIGMKGISIGFDSYQKGRNTVDRSPLCLPETITGTWNGEIVEFGREWIDIVYQSLDVAKLSDNRLQQLKTDLRGAKF